MKIRAAEAIAASIQGQPTRTYIIPDSLDKDVSIKIAEELGKISEQSRTRANVTH